MTDPEQRSASWVPVAVLAVVLVAVQATVFFGLRAGETRLLFATAELAPSLEVYGERTLSQTFTAQADGLTAITVYPSPRRGPITGMVELTLEGDSPTPLARASVARRTSPVARPSPGRFRRWRRPPGGSCA